MCVLDGKEDLLDSPRPEIHVNSGYEGKLLDLTSTIVS